MARPGRPGSTRRVSLAPAEEQVAAPRAAGRGITRRQALAAAVATGLGVGAIRLLGGSMQQIATPRSASAGGWISPLSSESARVMHLLRRTSYGFTPNQLEAALSAGFGNTVDRLIETKPVEPPALAAA